MKPGPEPKATQLVEAAQHVETAQRAERAEGASLLDAVLAETRIPRGDPAYARTRDAVEALLAGLLRREGGVEEVDRASVDFMIAELEERITAQVDELLHHPELQRLEASWRGLEFLVDRIAFEENIALELLSVSKEELGRDFEDAPELTGSGFYNIAYSREFGQFGGDPYALILADYEFGPEPRELDLLRQCAAVSAMAHAIFIANAAPSFFGLGSFAELSELGELTDLLERGPQYEVWRTFRESEDARYVGLCLPRFLLRVPYGDAKTRVNGFAFEEEVGRHDRYLWGHASYAFATRVADSFARYRWCPNIVGPNSGGAVPEMILDTHPALGSHRSEKICTESLITDRRELELAELGFISLVHRRLEGDACFFSASSVQNAKPIVAAGGREAETNHRLGAQLPYMFVIARLAHYVKVIERNLIGKDRTAADIQRDLTAWIRQYVNPIEDRETRAKKPLKDATVEVEAVEGQAGWYRCRITVQPHFRYMNATFKLSLVGKIDRKER